MDKDFDTSFLGHPKPLFSLFLTELWERFSFYGIRPLLIFFMMASVQMGGLGMNRDEASAIVGIFAGSMYIAALPGGWLADNILGQKRAIFIGATIIALGHLAIALSWFHSCMLFVGLALIVLGSGLFKTCASVMVGALYKPGDVRLDSGFTIFYMGINVGAFLAPLVCGALQENCGFHAGFAAGGVGMLVSLAIFYFRAIRDFDTYDRKFGLNEDWHPLDRVDYTRVRKILAIAAASCLALVALFHFDVLTLEAVAISESMVVLMALCLALYFIWLFLSPQFDWAEKKSLVALLAYLCAAAIFFSAFEQQPTSYSLFANDFTDRNFLGFEVPVAWFQSFNPVFIIVFAPLTATFWLFLSKKGWECSSTSKFALGLLFAGIGFCIMYFAALDVLDAKHRASMLWIVSSLFFLTLGEICLSPVGLSIVTQIAPKAIKSQAMGLWFFTTAFGNIIAGLLGANVDTSKTELLPGLFKSCCITLFAAALALFLLKGYIFKLIRK